MSAGLKHQPHLSIIAMALLLGVCLLHFQPDILISIWTDSSILALLPIFFCGFIFLTKLRAYFAFLLGYSWALLFAVLYLQQQLPESLMGKSILVEGRVYGMVESSPKSMRFNFKVSKYLSVDDNQEFNFNHRMPSQLRLSWYYSKKKLRSGDEWRFLLRLKPPHGMQNPSGFDYEKWLYQQRINATGYVRKSDYNQFINSNIYNLDYIRGRLLNVISSLPDKQFQGLLQALTIGHKTNISSEQWEVFKATGTNHLMAISGLHIGLVAGMVFFLISRLVPAGLLKFACSSQYAAIFSLFAAGFYALLAGFGVPTQRAFVMLLVFMSAILLKRSAFSLNTLSLALIAVIMLNPLSVLSAGFWLSFLAVLIITLVSAARISAKKSKWQAWLQGVRVQWLIALGMLPICALLFQQASIISPLANMLVIPLLGFFVVPLALLASVISLLSLDYGIVLFGFASDLLGIIWIILDYLAKLPLASWKVASIPLLPSILALLGVLILLLPKGFPLRYSGLIMLIPMIVYQAEKPQKNHFWLTVLDVGQGLSVLIQTKNHALLYDSGAKFGPRFDMGQRVVLPYLLSIGVEQLDVLLISHGDNDHIGGAPSILKQTQVAQLLAEASVLDDLNYLPQASRACKAGQKWQWDGVEFEIIHPPAPSIRRYKKSNNRSCVLRVANQRFSVLLTGDVERKAEKSMLKNTDLKPVDVLIVPHHGSNTSSTIMWLEVLKPKLAIVSAGYKNRFSHPTEKILARYKQQGIRLLNTAYEGAVKVRSVDKLRIDKQAITSQRKLVKHYWNHRP